MLETLRLALNQLSEADPQWVRGWVPREWYERYGPRADSFHLPKAASQRETLAVQIGADGYTRSEEHTSELQSLAYLVCRLLLEKKKKAKTTQNLHLTSAGDR